MTDWLLILVLAGQALQVYLSLRTQPAAESSPELPHEHHCEPVCHLPLARHDDIHPPECQ